MESIEIRTSWCVDDIRGALDVDHMTDEEIQVELGNLAKGFHEMCVQGGWDVIYNCFKIKEEVDADVHNHPLGIGFAQKDKKGDK